MDSQALLRGRCASPPKSDGQQNRGRELEEVHPSNFPRIAHETWRRGESRYNNPTELYFEVSLPRVVKRRVESIAYLHAPRSLKGSPQSRHYGCEAP